MNEDAAQQQATLTAERVAVLLAAWQAGRLTQDDFTRATAVAVFSGKIMAARFADILVSTLANARPIGLIPGEQHLDRLTEAVQTIVDEPDGHAERLERLAVAETLASFRKTLHAAIRQQGFPEWQRIPADDPCEVCEPLAYEVQPIGVGFRDHPGCRCSLRPYGERVAVQTPEREEPVPRIRRTLHVG